VAAFAGSVSPSELICGCRQCERVAAGSGRLREAASILAHADATAQPIWQMRMCSAENLAAAAQISEPLRCNHRATAKRHASCFTEVGAVPSRRLPAATLWRCCRAGGGLERREHR
jgi:hypothetical protein